MYNEISCILFHSLKCKFVIMSRSDKKSCDYYHRLNQVK